MSDNGPQSAGPVPMFPGALCPSLMITYRVGVPVKRAANYLLSVDERADSEEIQDLKFLQSA